MNTVGRTDEELMQGYMAGDKSSFEELYKRYEAKIYTLLRRRVGINSMEVIDDLFQASWLKLHRAKDIYDPNKKFSSWFYAISLNVVRDYFRKSSTKNKFTVKQDELETLSLEDSNSVENMIIEKDLLREVEKYLPTLTDLQREVILLSDWEGMKSKEISEMLKIPDNRVRQLLYRARVALRKRVEL